MTHPYRRIAAKLRAQGKLASKKEIAATKKFYELDDFGDALDDEAIVKANRELVRRKFFHENGHCKRHNNIDCIYCRDMLRG